MFYLTTHSTHFIYGYMASDIWLRTILIVREETRCRHIGYSFRLAARVLLYAPSHKQNSTYHGLCYTSRGALAGTRNSSMGSNLRNIYIYKLKTHTHTYIYIYENAIICLDIINIFKCVFCWFVLLDFGGYQYSLVPASATRLVQQRLWYIQPCLLLLIENSSPCSCGSGFSL